MRFGICTGVDHLPLLEQAGYDYLEASVAGTLRPEMAEEDVLPDLNKRVGVSPLKVEAFNVFLPGDLKVVGEAVDAARQERYLTAAFARVSSLGGQVVVFGSGGARQIPEGFSRETARRQVEEFLHRCGSAAAPHDVLLAIEPLNRRECNHINSVAEALEIAQAVGHPNIGVLADLYHIMEEGQSLDETRSAGRLLFHAHVAGAENRRAPGREDVPFLTPFFRALKDINYAGRVSVEGGWADLPTQASETRAALRQAWEEA